MLKMLNPEVQQDENREINMIYHEIMQQMIPLKCNDLITNTTPKLFSTE
jgi:hypothetical protein